MYADDLMVLGMATVEEVKEVKAVFTRFGEKLGLVVNPEKSTMWFSQKCDPECRQNILAEFTARLAGEHEKYLGILVTQTPNARDLTHDQLVDKFQKKLSGWKANLLSHAGRLTLIKTVLFSLPVYYMSVAKLPQRTIQALTASIRRFLWGKMHQDRYISLIGWSKVCAGWEDGGLEIRDLGLFNEALLLKLVWQVAADVDKIWVQIFKAKYYPRKGLWGNSSGRGYSALGRVVQQLKPFFLEEVLWHVGSGEGISAINQPWYDGWDTQQCNTNAQRDAKVADLFDHSTKKWDTHKIQILMSEGAVTAITNSARKPEQQPLIEDRLIWLCSQRGTYTTKDGYKKLKEQMLAPTQHYTEDQKRAWQRVWSNKEIIPRIKFFLWRAIHNGLPTLQKLHSRIPGINPRCKRCDSEDEFLMHTLFFCHIARQTWWVSELGLRVDSVSI